MGRRALLSTLMIILLFVSLFSNIFLFGPFVIFRANPGDISESWDNTTTLNVTVLHLQPRINWFDFQYNQSGTWVSRLNQQIDVNNSAEYRFIVNISSDQGWDDIEYVNITAWADLGNEASTYNSTSGSNINLNLSYENTSGTATWTLHWPDDEVTLNQEDCTEWEETDPDGSPGNTECYNLTFAFTPSYQFRHAPGAGNTAAGYNDLWSWNFNITAEDQSDYKSYDNPIVGESVSEFGVYSYTEIVSVGWPTITGNPGTTAYNDSYISIETRSNGNYSLSVNITNLTHSVNPIYTLANTSIWTAGGEISSLTQFDGSNEQWYYGGAGSYTNAANDDTSLTTSDIEWAVTIPIAQYPGNYTASIYYHLLTEL
jgi:hypothetical protein